MKITNKMNKKIAILFICITVSAIMCSKTFAQSSDIDAFTKTLSASMLESTTALRATPDAYIGKFHPSLPPHFHLGYAASATVLGTKKLQSGMNNASVSLPSMGDLIAIPTYGVNFRLGGFGIPFDIGFLASFSIPTDGMNIKHKDVTSSTKFTGVGIDVRFAILQGRWKMPQLSVGIGYIFNWAEIEFSGKANSIKSTATFDIKMHTIFLEMQLSKRFAWFNPYIGGRALLSKRDSSYNYKNDAATPITGSGDVSQNFSFAEIQPQVFAGFGFMMPHSQINLHVHWNPISNLWSVSALAGFRM